MEHDLDRNLDHGLQLKNNSRSVQKIQHDIGILQRTSALLNNESESFRELAQTQTQLAEKVADNNNGGSNQIMINTGPVTAHTVLLNLVPASVPSHKKQNFFFGAN